MSMPATYQPDPSRDLVLERIIDAPPARVWAAWTTAEQVARWFTPAPWTTRCEIDLRPGGRFVTAMRSPEGDEATYVGCYLEIVEPERLVWTSMLGAGFRPAPADAGAVPFTIVVSLEPLGERTAYRCVAVHGDEATCASHRDMGFHEGWGAALDQLVALVTTG
jgi:uncharacterized protein YndB with AHSA1/START domain